MLYGISVIMYLHQNLWHFFWMFVGVGLLWQLTDDWVKYDRESKSSCNATKETVSDSATKETKCATKETKL